MGFVATFRLMYKAARLSLLLIFFTVGLCHAQEFGGNPPSIKLKQVQTPVARVIYPAGLDSAAMRVANIVTQMNKGMQATIGGKQRQVSIVLQNQTTISNAYVSLAPFRSEFFLTPDQNNFDVGSLYWPDQLAIHEFRHVQQYNNFNVGFSHVLRILFGEGGQALGNGITIPNWFFEGDAVYNETHVSGQGRGRLPYFFNGYRALWEANRNYSWQKLRNGSYLDYTPDWYPTGYMMAAYGRQTYGEQFWKNVTHDAASFNGVFYPLQHAIKKYSGDNFSVFRSKALAHFKNEFHADADSAQKSAQVNITKHFDANREYPAFVNDSTLVYVKSTYTHIPEFIIRIGNTETNIRARDMSLDNYFSYNKGLIVYPSYRGDLRWGYRDYSELNILDIKTGTQKRITSRTKYFSPAFNDDNTRVVAVNVSPNGKSQLHILDASTGKLISAVPNNADLFYSYPKFSDANSLVAAIRYKNGKNTLARIDITSGKVTPLLAVCYQPVGFLAIDHNDIIFTATVDHNDRLFRLSLADNSLQELKNFRVNGLVGNYEPAISNNKTVAWVGFSAVGYQIVQQPQSQQQWVNVSPGKLPGSLSDMGITVLAKDTIADKLDFIANNPLPVSNYKKSYHLFNFHSLIPSLDDPNYSVALVGENVINTFQSQLSFNYNRDEGYKKLGFDAVYGALFPYIAAGAGYTFDRNAFNGTKNVYWNETNVYGGGELPFNLSRGLNITSLTVKSELNYTQANFQPAFTQQYHDYHYTYLYTSLSFSNQLQKAKQNIYPHFGQSLYFNYRNGINGIDASQYLVDGSLYLPGIGVNHSLVLNGAHQQRNDSDIAPYSNDFPFSRGYQAENFHVMNKLGANYHFPIFYPDAGAFNTVYLLRLRANLFYDYTRVNQTFSGNRLFNGNFRSTGAEVYFDTQWFNNLPITFGVRYSRLLDEDMFGGNGRNRFELIVPVAIF